MTFLGKLILALLALGVQLPALPNLALCLCWVLPFTCAQAGGCVAEQVPTSPCCEPPAETGAPTDVDGPRGEPVACGCELDLGSLEVDPLAAGPQRGVAELHLALPAEGGSVVAFPPAGIASRRDSARASPAVTVQVNRTLRI